MWHPLTVTILRKGPCTVTGSKGWARTMGIVQIAGASEHQSGLAADVVSWKYRDGFKTSFANTAEGKWLATNCARFGFIIRYPKDKMDRTGIHYEAVACALRGRGRPPRTSWTRG